MSIKPTPLTEADIASTRASYFPRDRWFALSIIITTLATTILALIAAWGQISVIAASIASVTGIIDVVTFIGLCCKKCTLPRTRETQTALQKTVEEPHTIDILPPIRKAL